MCLTEIWTDGEMNRWLESQGEVIEVWKSARANGKAFVPPVAEVYLSSYKSGCQKARQKIIHWQPKLRYWSGFHFFINQKKAEYYSTLDSPRDPEGVIKCLIKKEWITAIGTEAIGDSPICLVASQAVFPHYPQTEARWSDIEPFLKENKKEPALARS